MTPDEAEALLQEAITLDPEYAAVSGTVNG